MFGRCPCNGISKISGDDFQRHVDAGGDAGGSEKGAVFNEMKLLFDMGFRKQLLHPVQGTPVRSSSLAIEKPGFTEQQGACTY